MASAGGIPSTQAEREREGPPAPSARKPLGRSASAAIGRANEPVAVVAGEAPPFEIGMMRLTAPNKCL